VGIDEEHNNKESVAEFIVMGDGKELWVVVKGGRPRVVKVDVKDIRRLELRVRREGEGGRIHADGRRELINEASSG